MIEQKQLEIILKKVRSPGRYSGGEYGSLNKPFSASLLNMVLCFPDLYEIGMSNHAIRLLYQLFNQSPTIRCERVFAPDLDFEAELRKVRLALFSLESRTALKDFDIIGFSLGYELAATSVLNVLDLGGIPLLNEARGEQDPIVVAGGPAVTNPKPYAGFIDAFYIGEAEDQAVAVFESLFKLKQQGARRKDLIRHLSTFPSIWTKDKQEKTVRHLWQGFGKKISHPEPLVVPNIRTVQDRGVVEIMRGCPNGCRFCHAGILYRPYRQKEWDVIVKEVDHLVYDCGYREITLSSLSSGDYHGIEKLIHHLNRRYQDEHISFSLPSLKVNSFTLPVLLELSRVRKSGLTFAVETPLEGWQKSLNKEVPFAKTVEILRKARSLGWRQAKFYFMIGLPFTDPATEADEIVGFLTDLKQEVSIQINVNIGTFIPKPHTPFERSLQLTEQQALEKIQTIRHSLKSRGFKVGYHSPFLSFLEGMIARGDERVGEIILAAYQKGARLDAWEEYVRWDVWRECLANAGWDVEKEICAERPREDPLPWHTISLGVSGSFLNSEYDKAKEQETTPACDLECSHLCGVCNKRVQPRQASLAETNDPLLDVARTEASIAKQHNSHGYTKTLFSFKKQGELIYTSHLSMLSIFERALLRAGVKVRFTEGYNPKPKMEFAHPLSLGILSEEEIAMVELREDLVRDFVALINPRLPQGLEVTRAETITGAGGGGQKKKSLMALYWGSRYEVQIPDGQASEKAEVLEKLTDFFIHKGFKDNECAVQIIDTGLSVLLKNKGTKDSNILKVLSQISVDDTLARFRVIRKELFAGKDDLPVSYFDLLCH